MGHLDGGLGQWRRKDIGLDEAAVIGEADDVEIAGGTVDETEEKQAAAADDEEAIRRPAVLEDGPERAERLFGSFELKQHTRSLPA